MQEEIDENNAKLRSEDRSSNLFGLFSLMQNTGGAEQPNAGFDDPEFPIEKLHQPSPPTEHFGHRLLVKCLCLEYVFIRICFFQIFFFFFFEILKFAISNISGLK